MATQFLKWNNLISIVLPANLIICILCIFYQCWPLNNASQAHRTRININGYNNNRGKSFRACKTIPYEIKFIFIESASKIHLAAVDVAMAHLVRHNYCRSGNLIARYWLTIKCYQWFYRGEHEIRIYDSDWDFICRFRNWAIAHWASFKWKWILYSIRRANAAIVIFLNRILPRILCKTVISTAISTAQLVPFYANITS